MKRIAMIGLMGSGVLAMTTLAGVQPSVGAEVTTEQNGFSVAKKSPAAPNNLGWQYFSVTDSQPETQQYTFTAKTEGVKPLETVVVLT
jgi:hypothetical protein